MLVGAREDTIAVKLFCDECDSHSQVLRLSLMFDIDVGDQPEGFEPNQNAYYECDLCVPCRSRRLEPVIKTWGDLSICNGPPLSRYSALQAPPDELVEGARHAPFWGVV
jgi:hypothetical protein